MPGPSVPGPPCSLEAALRHRFPQIDPSAWEHPSDRAALDTLRQVPGFEAVLRTTIGRLQDAIALRRFLAQARPADEAHPRVARLWAEVQEVLDPPEPVPLYVGESEAINGFTVGVRQPHVVLTSQAVAKLRPDQIQAILAHELGHVLSGHVLYKTVVRTLDATRWWVLPGGANLALTGPLLLALFAWDRASELSADRAELLVVQDLEASLSLLRALEGPVREKMEARYRRIAEVSQVGADVLQKLDEAFARHPPIERRMAELQAWHGSETYQAILAGDYPRRDPDALRAPGLEERVASLRDGLQAQLGEAGEAGSRLQAQANRLGDRLAEQGAAATAWLSEAGGSVADQAEKALDWLAARTGRGED